MPAVVPPNWPMWSFIAPLALTPFQRVDLWQPSPLPGRFQGWQKAYTFSTEKLGGKLPLSRLLEDAIFYAANGVSVTSTLANNTTAKLSELQDVPGFADAYLTNGKPMAPGARHVQKKLAATLEHLAQNGLDDFYRGDLARAMAVDLEAMGSPLRLSDLERHRALDVTPLELQVCRA